MPAGSGLAAAGSVAITIDDGPSSEWVDEACAIAKRHSATLTFFVCGYQIQADPTILPRLVAAGHDVENHSYNHPVLPALPANMIEWQLRRTSELIHEQTGRRPIFVRPPYGAYSHRTGRALSATGHRLAMWTVDPKDWNGKSASEIATHVLSRVRDGSVVLLHQRHATLEALPSILAGCRKKGLACVSLRQLWHVPGSAPGAEHLAPLRALTDDQTTVDWNQGTKTAVLKRRELAIRFRVGDRAATVNGQRMALPVAPALHRGQLYVPDEFIAAALAETMESTETGQRAAQTDRPVLVAQPDTDDAGPAAPAASRPVVVDIGASKPAITLAATPRATVPDRSPTVRGESAPEETPLQRHLQLGLNYKRKHDYAAAADEFLAATRRAPESTEAHWALAWTLTELNLQAWAQREFTRVRELDANGPRGRHAARLLAQ